MKKFIKLSSIFLFITTLYLSCNKDNTDIRKNVVGTYGGEIIWTLGWSKLNSNYSDTDRRTDVKFSVAIDSFNSHGLIITEIGLGVGGVYNLSVKADSVTNTSSGIYFIIPQQSISMSVNFLYGFGITTELNITGSSLTNYGSYINKNKQFGFIYAGTIIQTYKNELITLPISILINSNIKITSD